MSEILKKVKELESADKVSLMDLMKYFGEEENNKTYPKLQTKEMKDLTPEEKKELKEELFKLAKNS